MVAGVISESGARETHDPETYSLATSHRRKAAAEANGVDFLALMNVTAMAELCGLSTDDLLTYDNLDSTILHGTAFANVSAFYRAS